MTIRALFSLIMLNLRASRASALFAVIGIAVGVAFLSFFLGLGEGVRERVLNRIFPADQIEIEPRSVRIFGVEGSVGQAPLDKHRLASVVALPGVVRAVGKQKSAFPARLWGGKRLLGFDLHTEAFFDGLPTELLRDELRESERNARGTRGGEAGARCDVDIDCQPGERCREGACSTIVWADRFTTEHLTLACASDDDCRPGLTCGAGSCQGPGVAPQVEPQRCRLESAAAAWDLLAPSARGHVLGPCPDSKGKCATARRCPEPAYCATDARDSLDGRCEWPIPTLVNPLLLEVFNSDMAASLGIARMASTDVLYGVRYHIAFGDSHFTEDAPRGRQLMRQAVVVGFSNKAPELGVALPIELVRHQNVRFAGRSRAALFDSVIVQVANNEAVPGVIESIEDLGFALSRRSRIARTFGTVVFLVWLALVLTALVVLLVAAINIAHTFAILVHERRREIAILRSLGATRRAIAAMIIGEALMLGTFGGLLGFGVAWLGAHAVDLAAGQALQGLPLIPTSFFLFPVWTAPLALLIAWVFCVAGAAAPALRATRLDPATVLSEP